ncbi:MAG TPA: acyl-CoA desaturase [Mycobacteriales bacterium]|nr:acyl-CoA desaturase [Mycobacteriales bacterium]
MTTTSLVPPPVQSHLDTRKRPGEQVALLAVVLIPFIAVIAAVPLLWGRGISTTDVVLAAVFYAVSGHGITVGFHRYFTHGAFKATRALRVGLAIAGSMAIQGPVIRWVADHRRHHAFSDRDGDPHSPHRYGTGVRATLKGLWHAHLGWLFDPEQTSLKKYAPDLLADRAIVWVHRLFPAIISASLLMPALLGGLITWSWQGALSAFFWAGLVRVFVLHHVTWSINSVCHMFGTRPYSNRDRSTNFWPLAFISMGESWHNLHHADPTLARHGVEKGQLDTSAHVIEIFERLGWARDVRWPDAERLAARRAA